MAFHSLGRLLFHDWIPGGAGDKLGTQGTDEGAPGGGEAEEEGGCGDQGPRQGTRLSSLGLPPSSPTAYDDDDDDVPVLPACAEQALLRLSLILYETTTTSATSNRSSSSKTNRRKRVDPRVRAAARGLAAGLRSVSRKRPARHLIARSALLVLDHGLANGSLDGLRERFPPAVRPRPRGGFDVSGGGGVGERVGGGPGSPSAMSVSSGDLDVFCDDELGGWGARTGGGVGPSRRGDGYAAGADDGGAVGAGTISRQPYGSQGSDDEPAGDEGVDGGHRRGRQARAGLGEGGGRENSVMSRGGGGREAPAPEATTLNGDALQYASAVRFLVAVGALVF